MNATQFQIAESLRLRETIGTFNLCNLVEFTIIQKNNAAVDYECLADLIYDETGLLTGTIPDILASLFKTYGNITAQTLTAKQYMVESIPYNHTKTLSTIFHAIN